MIDPELMCDKHLLGEHNEIHKHLPTFKGGVSIRGRIYPVVQIELCSMKSRHDELAIEIDKRARIKNTGGHKSPFSHVQYLENIYPDFYNKKVDQQVSIQDLCNRCESCKKRIIRSINE